MMNANLEELGKKLHVKLDQGIDQLKTTKAHLEALQKETEATIQTKLNAAKQAVEAKKQEAAAARAKVDEFVEEKKAETKEVVAEWKAHHDNKKLEKRADRAEKHADVYVALALYYSQEAELAILEAVAARQDAEEA